MKSFEDRLNRLEEVSDLIKGSDIPLEEAVSLFEEGIKIARSLEKELTRIEKRVEIMVNQPDAPQDAPVLELFPDLSNNEGIEEQ